MVVPNRHIRNRDASTIREILTTEANLVIIVNFGSNEVFEKTSAYIGSIVAQKISPAKQYLAASTRVINVTSIASEFLAAGLINSSNLGIELRKEGLGA